MYLNIITSFLKWSGMDKMINPLKQVEEFYFSSLKKIKLSHKHILNMRIYVSGHAQTHKHTHTHAHTINTSLAALYGSTLEYSELRCGAVRAQSTLRQLGSRKQYKIDMHMPLCLSEVCGAWMPGGAALLTQASLPHCNTGSLIRYNKRGNEVRQRGESIGEGLWKARPILCSVHVRKMVLYLHWNNVRAAGPTWMLPEIPQSITHIDSKTDIHWSPQCSYIRSCLIRVWASALQHSLKAWYSVGKTCLSPSRSRAHRSATQGAVSFTGPPPQTALIAPFYLSASPCFHLCICTGKRTGLANWWSGDGCRTGGWPLADGGPKGWN